MIHTVRFTHEDADVEVGLRRVLALGYTGRDRSVVQEHVDELAEIGVAPPPRIPMLYPVMPTLVTPSSRIAVLGPDSTPEIEVAIVRWDGSDYLTVCSDHTDRRIEATSVPQSKNACPKPVARTLWHVEEVADHWDDLELISRAGDRILQRGTLGGLLPYEELIDFANRHAGVEDGTLLMSGTVPTLAVPPKEGGTVSLELHDPRSERSIRHEYAVQVMEEFFA